MTICRSYNKVGIRRKKREYPYIIIQIMMNNVSL